MKPYVLLSLVNSNSTNKDLAAVLLKLRISTLGIGHCYRYFIYKIHDILDNYFNHRK